MVGDLEERHSRSDRKHAFDGAVHVGEQQGARSALSHLEDERGVVVGLDLDPPGIHPRAFHERLASAGCLESSGGNPGVRGRKRRRRRAVRHESPRTSSLRQPPAR